MFHHNNPKAPLVASLLKLAQAIEVLGELLECFEARDVKGASVGIASAEAFDVDRHGYTLSVRKKESEHMYGCLKTFAQKHSLMIFEKEGYWILTKPYSF